MNSSHSHAHPHHPPHGLHSSQPQHLVFGQLPPHNTYEATHNNSAISPPSGPITVDTSSPPLHQHQAYGNYGAPTVSHPQSAQAQQHQQQQLSTSTASGNNFVLPKITWNRLSVHIIFSLYISRIFTKKTYVFNLTKKFSKKNPSFFSNIQLNSNSNNNNNNRQLKVTEWAGPGDVVRDQ